MTSLYPHRQMSDQERELRRRINENLTKIANGTYRREREAKIKAKGNELSKAFAWEIQLGYDALQRREFSRRFNQLMRRKQLDRESELETEELQGMIDTLDERLRDYGRDELSRFVRLWNKSQKQRYKLP